jgi:hypothetical protein
MISEPGSITSIPRRWPAAAPSIEMRLRLIRRVEPSSGESINVHTQSPASESGNDINEALGSVSVEAKYLLQLGDLANEPDLLDLDLTDPSGLASDLELDLSSAPRISYTTSSVHSKLDEASVLSIHSVVSSNTFTT